LTKQQKGVEQKSSTPKKTMQLLLLSVILGAILFAISIGIHDIAMWMQRREEKQLRGQEYDNN